MVCTARAPLRMIRGDVICLVDLVNVAVHDVWDWSVDWNELYRGPWLVTLNGVVAVVEKVVCLGAWLRVSAGLLSSRGAVHLGG
jgi:hypothetical protein